MNVIGFPNRADDAVPAVTQVGTCDAPDGLAAIRESGRELMICERRLPLCLTAWLEQVPASRLPDFRILVAPGDFRAAADILLNDCGMPRGDMRDLLADDIDGLVAAFAHIARERLVDVRLERIEHDACWKFHRDSVETRLLTTYLGPATEWVRPFQAERALKDQKDFDGPVESLGLNDIAVFKGSRAGTGDGIVHRSPPIAGSGQVRLLLCLNARSSTSPAPWRKDVGMQDAEA